MLSNGECESKTPIFWSLAVKRQQGRETAAIIQQASAFLGVPPIQLYRSAQVSRERRQLLALARRLPWRSQNRFFQRR